MSSAVAEITASNASGARQHAQPGTGSQPCPGLFRAQQNRGGQGFDAGRRQQQHRHPGPGRQIGFDEPANQQAHGEQIRRRDSGLHSGESQGTVKTLPGPGKPGPQIAAAERQSLRIDLSEQPQPHQQQAPVRHAPFFQPAGLQCPEPGAVQQRPTPNPRRHRPGGGAAGVAEEIRQGGNAGRQIILQPFQNQAQDHSQQDRQRAGPQAAQSAPEAQGEKQAEGKIA